MTMAMMMMMVAVRMMMNLSEGGEGERERAGTLSAFPESFRACNVIIITITIIPIIAKVMMMIIICKPGAV